MASRDGAVDDQHIAVVDAFSDHAVSAGPHIEGGRRVGDTVLVEVDGLFHIVLSRGGKPTGGRGEEQRELYDRCIGSVGDHGNCHCMNIQLFYPRDPERSLVGNRVLAVRAVPRRIMLGRNRLGESGLSSDGGAVHVHQLHPDHQGGAGGILRAVSTECKYWRGC